MVALSRVFGIDRTNNLLSHVVRDVDNEFVRAINDPQYVVITVYGPSKQGKTSLCRSVLTDDNCIRVRCAPAIDTGQIFVSILEGLGASDKVELTTERHGEAETSAWIFKVKAGAGIERRVQFVKADLSVPQTVSRKLTEITQKRIVVLDNFHYLEKHTQEVLARSIRSFEEDGFKFVILGTWSSRDYLTRATPELAGTLKNLPIEPWSSNDLRRVLLNGEPHLNISFTPRTKDRLTDLCEGNVALLQNVTKKFLESVGVEHKHEGSAAKVISDHVRLDSVIGAVKEELKAQVLSQLRRIAEIGQPLARGRTRSYYLVQGFLSGQISDIREGMPGDKLLSKANLAISTADKRAATIKPTDFGTLVKTQWLAFQQKNFATPILAFDADEDCLIVVDSWTRFVLAREHLKLAAEM